MDMYGPEWTEMDYGPNDFVHSVHVSPYMSIGNKMLNKSRKIRKQKQRIALLAAIGIAVFLHVAAIYSLQDLPIKAFLSAKEALLYTFSGTDNSKQEETSSPEVIKRKNEELEVVFNEWIRPPEQGKLQSFDLKSVKADQMKTEWQGMALEVAATSMEETEPAPFLDIDNHIANLKSDSPSDLSHMPEEPVALPNIDQADAHPEMEEIVKSLGQAADAAAGLVAMESPSQLEVPSFPVGLDTAPSPLQDIVWRNVASTEQSPHETAKVESISDHTDLNSVKQEVLQKIASQNPEKRAPTSPGDHMGGQSPFSELKGGSQDEIHRVATVASTHAFALNVEYAPRQDGRGYLFRLTFIPKPGVIFKRIAQNYFFLIDRSHSIDARKYEIFKLAILRSLAYLKQGDTFNILIFDNKVARLSPVNLPWNQENFARAYDFLIQQPHGGMFATTDLYSSLGDIVPHAVADTEVNTAILLSDGDTFLNRDSQRQMIGKWTQRNNGKVSLFSLAGGQGNNLALLDLLSAFNKGFLCYNNNTNHLDETLIQLMQAIQHPIGKDILATPIIPSPEMHVRFGQAQRMPDLYEHMPYTIYGTTDRLMDFTVFLQGKYYDQWLDIKQTVSFSKGKRVPLSTLEAAWATQQAYELYDQYLSDGNPQHISRAKQLLTPYHIPTAFQ